MQVLRALKAVNACRAHAGGGHEGDVRVRGGGGDLPRHLTKGQPGRCWALLRLRKARWTRVTRCGRC